MIAAVVVLGGIAGYFKKAGNPSPDSITSASAVNTPNTPRSYASTHVNQRFNGVMSNKDIELRCGNPSKTSQSGSIVFYSYPMSPAGYRRWKEQEIKLPLNPATNVKPDVFGILHSDLSDDDLLLALPCIGSPSAKNNSGALQASKSQQVISQQPSVSTVDSSAAQMREQNAWVEQHINAIAHGSGSSVLSSMSGERDVGVHEYSTSGEVLEPCKWRVVSRDRWSWQSNHKPDWHSDETVACTINLRGLPSQIIDISKLDVNSNELGIRATVNWMLTFSGDKRIDCDANSLQRSAGLKSVTSMGIFYPSESATRSSAGSLKELIRKSCSE